MNPVQDFSNDAKKVIEHLREELQAIRTGRASSTIIEGMMIDTYGGSTKMKLMEMSSITSEGPTTLVVTPYDASTIQDIEKAFLKSPLGLTPKVQGNRILIVFPDLSQEQREKFVKLVGQTVEEHKVKIRGLRDDIRKKIKANFDAKSITEDDKFRQEKDIDTATQKFNEEMQDMKEKKEEQIRAI